MRFRPFVALTVALGLASIAAAQAPLPAPVRTVGGEQAPAFDSPLTGSTALPPLVAGSPLDAPSAGLGCVGGVCGPPGRTWVDSEFLIWWIQGMNTPPLLTSSPAGTPAATAGVIGNPGTGVVVGQDPVNSELRPGLRFRAGHWLDPEQRFGIEAHALILGSHGSVRGTGSDGSTILGRPFTTPANVDSAQLISFPGVASGSFTASTTSSTLVGAGFTLRENFWCSGDGCSTCGPCTAGCGAGGCASPWGCDFRFDSLFGYRFLRLSDSLSTAARTTRLVGGVPGAAGTTLLDIDEFSATNHFHGLDLGITGEIRRGNTYLELLGKVAVGYDMATARVNGQRTTTTPGGVGTLSQGGFLAQPSNIGTFTRREPTAVPELGLRLGWQLRPNVRLHATYSFLYWYHVVRAGDQPNGTINPAFLPGGGGTAAAVPATPGFAFQDVDIWMQGISFGLEWRF